MSGRLINPNLATLVTAFRNGQSGAVLEGSSRSAKTWSGIDFLIWLCSKVESNATIVLVKETYNSFKTTLYEDFNRRLPMYGIQSPFADRQEVRSFKLFGNTIHLLGADSDTVIHGVGSDYFFINESLDVNQSVFDQLEQRCRKFWWMDYNPKVTDHWIYDKICHRSDVAYLHSTLFDNPYISRQEKRKILSYEPTHPDDRHLPRKARRPHPTNIKEGTADEFMWDVYGLGLRSAPEGVIFKDIRWVDSFPIDLERVYYGLDFGFSVSPTALVRIAIDQPSTKDVRGNMWLEVMHYGPTESSALLAPVIEQLAPGRTVWADSAQKGMIAELRNKYKHKVIPVRKFEGSINYGISLLKQYNLHIINNQYASYARKEVGGYKWREVNGIRIEQPIDDFNHMWDAARYAALSNLRLAS